jgi:hypothetical protein
MTSRLLVLMWYVEVLLTWIVLGIEDQVVLDKLTGAAGRHSNKETM